MTWLFFGDSITVGLCRYLVALFLACHQTAVVKADVGDSTASWLSDNRARDTVRRVDPDFVVFALGTNDAADERTLRRRVERLVADAQRGPHVIGVFWIGPFDAAHAADPGAWLADEVGRLLTPENYVDGVPLGDGLPRARLGIHFIRDGYKLLAERIVPMLRELAERLYIE